MPFVRVWIHLIWSTKNREPMITRELRSRLLSHLRDNATSKGIRLDSLNAVSDHVHVLVSLGSDQSIAKVAQLLKGESSHWINHEKLTPFKFEWQEEYIAVSVSDSLVDVVRNYIKNQEAHHGKKSFAEEYEKFMQEYGFEVLRKDGN
jgi:putative transposase